MSGYTRMLARASQLHATSKVCCASFIGAKFDHTDGYWYISAVGEAIGQRVKRKLVEWGAWPVGGAGKARVIMYHGISKPGSDLINVRHLGTDVFQEHLALFREYFHVVDLASLWSGERHPQKATIALTFDDGLRNNLTHALPLLEKYDMPASFFITGANALGLPILWGELLDLAGRHTDRTLLVEERTYRKDPEGRYRDPDTGILLRDRIKQAGHFSPKAELYAQFADLITGPLAKDAHLWQLLSDEDLRQLAAHPLIEIGAHGFAHNDMGVQEPLVTVEELRQSKVYLETCVQQPVVSLAWPSGSYSRRNMDDAFSIGFTRQLAVDLQHADDVHDPRIRDRYGVYHFPVHPRFLMHSIARGAR